MLLSLLASLVLSFTVVPVMFDYLMSHQPAIEHGRRMPTGRPQSVRLGPLRLQPGFRTAPRWRIATRWPGRSARPWLTAAFFGVLMVVSLALFPILGRDFFPNVDAGQMRLHIRAPAGSRIEVTGQYFAQVEKAVREIVGNDQIKTVLDNIGLPYSGMNMAIGDTATVGTMDGEMLISLNEDHTPTAAHMADLAAGTSQALSRLPILFPGRRHRQSGAEFRSARLRSTCGWSAPIRTRPMPWRPSWPRIWAACRAWSTAMSTRCPTCRACKFDVDRSLAQQVGMTQQQAANSLLVTLNSSIQIGPNFWVNPKNGVSYPLVAQTPTYTINSLQDLQTMPLKPATGDGATAGGQLLMNVADIDRVQTPALISQLNVRPVFDVNANVQGRDLYGVSQRYPEGADRGPAAGRSSRSR